MGPSSISYLSNTAIFHFHDYGRKSNYETQQKMIDLYFGGSLTGMKWKKLPKTNSQLPQKGKDHLNQPTLLVQVLLLLVSRRVSY